MLSHFSQVQLFATLWTVTPQVPLSMGFSRQEYCHELRCPPPGNLPDPGIEPASLTSPAMAGVSLPLVTLTLTLVKFSWLGELVPVFWWMELGLVFLDGCTMSTGVFWGVHGFSMALGSLSDNMRGCALFC